jgi:hypothetical protein
VEVVLPALLGAGVLAVALIAVRLRQRRRRVAPVEIRPGDPIVGLPPRHPHYQPRSLPDDLRALTGPPGIGKSTAIYEYAHRRLEDFRFVGVVHAARTELIAEAYATFAKALRIEPTDDPVTAVHQALKERETWLIIFDDAGDPAELAAYLPPDGHYLVTSTSPQWGGTALEPFERKDSVEFLRDRCSGLDRKRAAVLAEALGDLPLALEIAGGYLDVSDVDDNRYVAEVLTQMSRIRRGALSALWSITAQYLRRRSLPTFEALEMWATLGTEPIPLAVFGADAEADLVARLGLAVHTGTQLLVHPLVQEQVRSGPDMRRRAAVVRAADLLRAYLTDASDEQWREVRSHVYAVLARPELDGDRTASWLRHHMTFVFGPRGSQAEAD